MRILVIGGTRLLGRHMVQTAIDRGHDVTIFNRGHSDPAAFPDATHLVGDRDSDLSALATGEWDATLDVCAYVQGQVQMLHEALGGRGGHHTFISTISVYGQHVIDSGFTEDTPLLEPDWDDVLVMDKYGELKVACEKVAAGYAGDGLLIIRPGYVIGPYDYTERFTHWVRVVAAGEPFDAPAADQPLQCIDGRDLAAFTIECIEGGVSDVFNVTAPDPAPTFAELLATIARGLELELPAINWADPSDDSEVLPLSAGPDWWPNMRASMAKATAAGLHWRPLEDTVRDIATFAGL